LHCDLFFIAKEGEMDTKKEKEQLNFFLSVTDFGLSIVRTLVGKGLSEITRALADALKIMKCHGWKVNLILSDGETNIGNAASIIETAPPHYARGSGNHDGRVEERVRRIKDNVRALQASLPYKLGDSLVVWAVYYATYVLNLMPARGHNICPRELLTGTKPIFKTVLPVGFGYFCFVKERITKSDLSPRTVTAISLLPTGRGSVKFASLTTGKVITREQFKTVGHIPEEYVKIVDAMQGKRLIGVEDLLQPRQEGPDPDSNLQMNSGEERTSDEGTPETEEITEIALTTPLTSIDRNCMTIKQAMSLHRRELVEAAIKRELTNMVEKSVFKVVNKDDAKQIIQGTIVPSKFFMKEKVNPHDRSFLELKGRLVAGGHRQDPSIYESKGSPTAKTTTIFLMMADAAHRDRSVTYLDVPCAYLHAKRGDLPKVHMYLQGMVAETYLKMTKTPDERDDKGRILVQIDGGLYGLIESGYLWYHHVKNFLTDFGMTCTPADPCLFVRGELAVAVYVDDLLITSKVQTESDTLVEKMRETFGDCKFITGKTIDLLGMRFTIKDGAVHVKINLDDILAGCQQVADTPCSADLFEVKPGPFQVSDEQKSKFHSLVAKLLYVAKRTRPDILLTISELTTKVTNPSYHDVLKLTRVIKYLNGTRDEVLQLKWGDQIQLHIDAAYGVHEDGKSHTGLVATMGNGCLLAASTKQKSVSKSSTEAELIALTDMAGEGISIQNIVFALTGKWLKVMLMQDNQATIHIIKNGLSARSKHVKIRFEWLKERIQTGDFEIIHTPSELMKADGMTKPKAPGNFKIFKEGLGIIHDHELPNCTKERAGDTELVVQPDNLVNLVNPGSGAEMGEDEGPTQE
jgi:hypothetical protein